MREWLLIGGGIHGCHLAIGLLDAGYSPESIRIVDPHATLLEHWDRTTANLHMPFLRTTLVHHLHPRHDSLWRFARSNRHLARFAPPYQQPAYELFQAHAHATIDEAQLAALHIRDTVDSLSFSGDGVTATTHNGDSLRARRVVLAIGSGLPAELPRWADTAPADRMHHVFDEAIVVDELPRIGPEVVVGGGLSAVQTALKRARPDTHVTIIARRPVRLAQGETDLGWLGPKYLASFIAEPDPESRRKLVEHGRRPGTIPREIQMSLNAAIEAGQISWQIGDVETAKQTADGDLAIAIHGGPIVRAARVFFATGYSSQRPGGALVDRLVRDEQLPTASCGYPLLDRALRWGSDRLLVTGRLAELSLGPAARNIAGARNAARLVLNAE